MRFGCADFKSPKSVAQSPKSWMEWLWSSGVDSKDRLHILKLSLKPGFFRVCESQENPPAMVCVTQQFYRRFQTVPCHHIQLQLELSQQLLGGVF